MSYRSENTLVDVGNAGVFAGTRCKGIGITTSSSAAASFTSARQVGLSARGEETMFDSLSVRERAEARKQLEEEQYEEALRQARITAAAERRLAAERARARMEDGELEDSAIASTNVHVAVPKRKPQQLAQTAGAAKGTSRRAAKGAFGTTWNDSVGGGGWSMLPDRVLDEEPPPPPAKTTSHSRGRGGCGAEKDACGMADFLNSQHAVRERQDLTRRREEEEYKASLTAARLEAAAERKRLALAQNRHVGMRTQRGTHSILADADPAAVDAMGCEAFQRMLHASEEQLVNALVTNPQRSASADNGVITVDLNPPRRRDKPVLSSQRRAEQAHEESAKTHTDIKLPTDRDNSPHTQQQQQSAPRQRAKWGMPQNLQLGGGGGDDDDAGGGRGGGGGGSVVLGRRGGRGSSDGGDGSFGRGGRGWGAPPPIEEYLRKCIFTDENQDVSQNLQARRRASAPSAEVGKGGALAMGKAARAAKAIEEKRRQRRAAAEAEKAEREAEVAQHGDRQHVLPRRMIANFRVELAAGTRVYQGRGIHANTYMHTLADEGQASLLVTVRKRPLLQHREQEDYDVLTAVGSQVLICHEPKKDMKENVTCHHHEFHFDHVFDEHASTGTLSRNK
jgi:hypothetical protein